MVVISCAYPLQREYFISKLFDSFGAALLQVVKDPFLKRLIDLECFVLSGLLADRYVSCFLSSI